MRYSAVTEYRMVIWYIPSSLPSLCDSGDSIMAVKGLAVQDISSFVTPCSSLRFRRTLWSSSHAVFVVTWERSIRTFGNRAFALGNRHHYYHFVKLTSSRTFSKFVTTRLSSITRFCARCFLFRRAQKWQFNSNNKKL